MLKRIMMLVVALLILVVAVGVVRTQTLPGHLYSEAGRFSACPARPSCVSSRAEDPDQAVAPLDLDGETEVVAGWLEDVLRSMPGLLSLDRDGNYLHAVFVTPRMRYRDDLELLIRDDGVVDVRSVSRFGYRDFGVNRERVDELRRRVTNG